MNAERQPSPDQAQPLLPLAMHEFIVEILQSSAVAAFAGRRVEQIIHYGHTDDGDLALDHLVREARARLDHTLDILGRGRTTMPPHRREQILRKIEIAGGLLIAAYEQLAAAPIAGFEPEDQ